MDKGGPRREKAIPGRFFPSLNHHFFKSMNPQTNAFSGKNKQQRKLRHVLILLFGFSLIAGWVAAKDRTSAPTRFSAQRFLENVRRLAGDELQGRGNGTPELNEAARFIAGRFRKFGLKPAPGAADYLQRFDITISAEMGQDNSLVAESAEGTGSLELNTDFRPLSFSSNASIEAPLVFVGYGITASEYNYDDYQHLDVRGKIAIVIHHEPQEHDERSIFAGRQYTAHGRTVNKAINAKNHGAVGIILVADVGNHRQRNQELFRFDSFSGPRTVGIPVLQVTTEVVSDWLRKAGHDEDVEALRKAIDEDLSNHSIELGDAVRLSIRTELKQKQAQVANVVGYLPGKDRRLRDEFIVLGAHYDHLGLGGPTSLAPSQNGSIHYGADDNASGTSGLIALARQFARNRKHLARSLIFVAFAGEEMGILGSNHYTHHPPVPLEQTVGMINLDMIGRASNGRLYVGGTGTSPAFEELVEEANQEIGLDLSFSITAYGASDHTSFAVKGIPVLFFFSGLHSDYHKPSDTWEKIDPENSVRVLDLVYRVAGELNRREERPLFVRVAEPHTAGASGGGGGYGPYFGSIPDFGQVENGVRFADIREGSPAGKAGLLAGDVLVEFDGKKIENLYDFTYALRARKPGDQVRVVVLREDRKISADVTLAVR